MGIEISGSNDASWTQLKDAPKPHPISVPWIGVKFIVT